jgi:hypothetical protein
MDRNEEINFLLRRLDISFYEPEFKIMNQLDQEFDKLLITGNGLCKVFKYFDTRQRLCLGTMKEGQLLGICQVMFECRPFYTIETMSYCTIGIIQNTAVKELLSNYIDMKKAFNDQVIQNPFDNERELFVKLCRQSIDYFKDTDEDLLRQLFYRSKHVFIDSK